MEKKTYLITGGAGFIGSTLADKLLDKGNKVIVVDNFCDFYDIKIKEKNISHNIDNDNYSLYRVDIRDKEKMDTIFSENKIDVIIHLAAMAGVRPSIENPILYQDVNCMGTLNIYECMKKFDIKKIVIASSSSVYGNSKHVPFYETDIVDFAISPYAASKKSTEVMGHVYHALYKYSMAFLRFFTVYGPRQRPDLAISKFTRLISDDQAINMFGDGLSSRDYTYVDDIVDGIEKSIDWVLRNDDVYEIFNIGESTPIKLTDMISTIEKTLGKKAIINSLPMQPGDVERTFASIDKAKEVLGYNPTTTFEDGIRKYVDWFRENK